jgi:predicted CXXCH cytochrome family protein
VLASLLSATLLAASRGEAKDRKPPAATKSAISKVATPSPLAPLGRDAGVVSTHSPYTEGDCSSCHQSNDAKNPGPVTRRVNDLCYDCHGEHSDLMRKGAVKHRPAVEACTSCHNPHNSTQKALLVEEVSALCARCHPKVKQLIDTAKVKHMPAVEGRKCVNCHNPHASNVEKLLSAPAYEQCVACHSKDGLEDAGGRVLTNFKKLLDQSPVRHGPLAVNDCSGCHVPHGSDNFRLLTQAYPASFYAAYDPDRYALCYECHIPDLVKSAETITQTKFRDGARNLHYLHVNKPDRGRTCRACHEVHASTQPHQIRDGVPFGSSGWILRINYKKTPTGGSCERTCHALASYDNTTKVTAPSSASGDEPRSGRAGLGR